MTVNDEFAPNRKPLFKKASQLPQPQQAKPKQTPPPFTRQPHQCPHLLGPTYEGSLVNGCNLHSSICTRSIYDNPEQYKTCEFRKIYERPIPGATE